jgi:hypothetical protein
MRSTYNNNPSTSEEISQIGVKPAPKTATLINKRQVFTNANQRRIGEHRNSDVAQALKNQLDSFGAEAQPESRV